MSYKIELTKMKDIDSILVLYSDRMKWFNDNHIKQRSRYLQNHPKEEFVETIENKNFYIIKQKNILVAGFELSTNNKDWNNVIVCFYSDNDPYVKYKVEKKFADTITNNQIMISGGGHLNVESGYSEFKGVYKCVLV